MFLSSVYASRLPCPRALVISCLGPADPALYSLVMYGASSGIPNETRSITYSVSRYSRDQGSKGVTRYMGNRLFGSSGQGKLCPRSLSIALCRTLREEERGYAEKGV